VPEEVITEPVWVAQYGDAIVIYLHGLDVMQAQYDPLQLRYRLIREDGTPGDPRTIDLTSPWEEPAIILEKGSTTNQSVLVTLHDAGGVFLSRLYDLGAELDPQPALPTVAENAAIEPGQYMGPAPTIPLPDLPQLPDVAAQLPSRQVSVEAVTRQVRSDINFPLVSANNSAALGRDTDHPSWDFVRSIYVPLKSQLYDPQTGEPTEVAHYLCEVPLNTLWLGGTNELVVNLGPDDIKVHNSDATYNGENILGEGGSGLGQVSGVLAVDGAGRIYYANVPSQVVRFDPYLADFEIPPVNIQSLIDPYLPTQDDIYGSGGSAPVGRWQSYRMVAHMNHASPARIFFAPVINRLLDGTYDWSGLFSMRTAYWDDAAAFTNAFHFHVGSWPSSTYTFYDTLVQAGDSNRRLRHFTAYGNTLYIESYPGAVGGPWRVDIAADGSVELFGTPGTLPDFSDGYSKPRETKPFDASGYIDWWDYGLLTMTRRSLHTVLNGWDDPSLSGHSEVSYDALAHMLLDTNRFAEILENTGGPSLAPGFLATPIPGEDGQLLGVAEYGYYLSRFDLNTADPGYVDKVYLEQDTGDPDLELPLAAGIGPYRSVWSRLGDDTWLYLGGYIGLTRMQYSTNGTPLGRYTMDKFDTRLSLVQLDQAGSGDILRYRYLLPGLDDRIFLTGTHTAARNGTAYSGGLMSFHQAQLDTLWKLSCMSRCYHTTRLRSRIVRQSDGTPVQGLYLVGGFDPSYAAELPPGDVPANDESKIFCYEYPSGGTMKDLFGFNPAPDNSGVALRGQALSANRRFLVVLLDNHFLTFDLQQNRFIDGKTLTIGSSLYVPDFVRPDHRLIRAPDDRLYVYAAENTSSTWALFIEILVSDEGLVSFDEHIRFYASSANTMNETYETVHTFMPDLANNDGSYDLVLGMPWLNSPGTNCRTIEDFVPPRRFDPARTLNVLSSPSGGADVLGTRPGQTPYATTCTDGEMVTLTAPGTMGQHPFLRWEDDGGQVLGANRTLELTMNADQAVFAVYDAGMSITAITASGGAGEVVITWSSMSNGTYQVLRGTNLMEGVFSPIATGIVATGTYTDDVGTLDRAFYQVEHVE
jgi:hypothetical protein